MVYVFIQMHIYEVAGIYLTLLLLLSGMMIPPLFFEIFMYLFNSFLSVILVKYNVQGFDVKSLRAFRVIRPLKLVNGVPSKYIYKLSSFIL
jgi:hypothetical protein